MPAIIGTAGHIDHGKSALVRALTGIETDRLREEQARGISIELGFAWMDLPDGSRAGIVDVPGHERFLRQMLAGAHGFDLVLLVVAADDGVMPQTEEHFEVCHLLRVKRAVFVITKADLVDAGRLAEVRDELEILAVDTPFEGAAVVEVSTVTGSGIEDLRARIFEELAALQDHAADGPLRLPVDRSFIMKGHGTVVTGTALTGSVSVGDEVEVLPAAARVRVRDVQVHGVAVASARAGQRVALNLVGVRPDEVARGSTVAAVGGAISSDRFDARVSIRPLAGGALPSHTGVRVYLGTAEVLGRLTWLDGVREVAPRESAYCQISLREPAVAGYGDRFIVRDQTARRTLGGGIVLVPQAQRHRRREVAVTPRLRVLETGSPEDRVAASISGAQALGCAVADLARQLGLTAEVVLRIAADSPDMLALPPGAPEVVVATAAADAWGARMLAAVEAFHSAEPAAVGIDLERLRGAVQPVVEPRLFRALIDRAEGGGQLQRRGGLVLQPGHEVSLEADEERLAAAVAEAIAGGGVMPPVIKELGESLGVDARRLQKILSVLAERGAVVRVSPDLAYSPAVVADLELRLREHLNQHREITAAGFRDLLNASRKYCIPLLDYFDREGITLRVGDARRLRAVS